MLAELVWGYGPSGVVYLGTLFTLVSLLFIYLFLRETAGVNAALAGSAFWALASNSVRLQADMPNTELFINCFTIMALWSFVRYRQGMRGFLVLSGLGLAAASTFKTVVLFPFLTVCIYLILPLPKRDLTAWLEGRAKRLGAFCLPGLIVWGGIFLYFALAGRFGDFWTSVFYYNRYYAGDIPTNILTLFTLTQNVKPLFIETGGLVITALLWLPFSRKEYGPLGRGFFILLALGIIIEVASPGKFYSHYYQLFLPVMTILSALFLSDIRTGRWGKWPAMTPAFAAIMFLIALCPMLYFQATYQFMAPEKVFLLKHNSIDTQAHELGEYVKTNTSPCETVYQWGKESGVYYYGGRRAASGIFTLHPLYMGPPELAKRLKIRLYEDVTGSPPALFLWNRQHGRGEEFTFSDFLRDNYDLIGWSGTINVYEYKYRKKEAGEDPCMEGK
jgi:hypothetical protein